MMFKNFQKVWGWFANMHELLKKKQQQKTQKLASESKKQFV